MKPTKYIPRPNDGPTVGPTYRGNMFTPYGADRPMVYRPGALDHTQCPSLRDGVRHPYAGIMCGPGSVEKARKA